MLGSDMKKYLDDYVAAWNDHDVDKIVSFYTDDCTRIDPLTGTLKGKDALRGFVITLFQAFPDMTVSMNDAVGSGDLLAAEWLSTGTQKGPLPPFSDLGATGRKIEMAGASFCRLRGDKIESETVYTDVGSMLDQMGVTIPEIHKAA